MYKFINVTQLNLLKLFLLFGILGVSIGLADDDLEVGKKSKELVDKMKQEEEELRAKTDKKIASTRELAIERLERLHRQYHSSKRMAEADSIKDEINRLKKKMGVPVDQVAEKHGPHGPDGHPRPDGHRRPNGPHDRVEPATPEQLAEVDEPEENSKGDVKNQYFNYQTSYQFDEKNIISGKFIFMQDNKVKVTYKYNNKETSEYWKWQDMGDHVSVTADSILGTIIISPRPNSDLKTLIVRWGGELKNKLTDAHSN